MLLSLPEGAQLYHRTRCGIIGPVLDIMNDILSELSVNVIRDQGVSLPEAFREEECACCHDLEQSRRHVGLVRRVKVKDDARAVVDLIDLVRWHVRPYANTIPESFLQGGQFLFPTTGERTDKTSVVLVARPTILGEVLTRIIRMRHVNSRDSVLVAEFLDLVVMRDDQCRWLALRDEALVNIRTEFRGEKHPRLRDLLCYTFMEGLPVLDEDNVTPLPPLFPTVSWGPTECPEIESNDLVSAILF